MSSAMPIATTVGTDPETSATGGLVRIEVRACTRVSKLNPPEPDAGRREFLQNRRPWLRFPFWPPTALRGTHVTLGGRQWYSGCRAPPHRERAPPSAQSDHGGPPPFRLLHPWREPTMESAG